MKLRKILAMLLVVCMVFGTMGTAVFAEETPDLTIGTAAELQAFAAQVNAGNS